MDQVCSCWSGRQAFKVDNRFVFWGGLTLEAWGGGPGLVDAHTQIAQKSDVRFDPNVKDGRGTNGLEINKTNWANTLDKPPYEAYQVGCGITFTFGGLRIKP